MDDCEEITAQLRVEASSGQVAQLLAWAPPDPGRIWAIENAHGMGHLLAQQLIGRGEVVVDVPATMAARVRKLSGKSSRKSDPQDARSVAITAAHNRGLRPTLAMLAAPVVLGQYRQLVVGGEPPTAWIPTAISSPRGAQPHTRGRLVP